MVSIGLDYRLRVRDLVHGFVYLTRPEVDVINHPLFQRLRHVRQNDVAFLVYPSLNISRFEHSLGCAHVAGKMATNVMRSAHWPSYQRALGLSPEEFVQTCRLYALMHDVGHLPLSHLFEEAFNKYIFDSIGAEARLEKYCREWFGVEGYIKLHEACGAAVAPKILSDISYDNDAVKQAVVTLMTKKELDPSHQLRPIKELVDSEIDADRVDATARDGRLAGQEYGNFDIERICSSIFVQPLGDHHWRIAYSYKALGSLEGLLLDRCRTHIWIHFHHRIVAMRVAASYLIAGLLREQKITKKAFQVADPKKMALVDDIWLWSKIRAHASSVGDEAGNAAVNALLYRDNKFVLPLWKNRTEYHDVMKQLSDSLHKVGVGFVKAGGHKPALKSQLLSRTYQSELTKALGKTVIPFWLAFNPFVEGSIPLTDENGSTNAGHLLHNSPLVESLSHMWDGEVQAYVFVLDATKEQRQEMIKGWIDFTLKWMEDHPAAPRA